MVTSPGSASPPIASMPPPLPQMDGVDPVLANYLRAFSQWAQRSLAGKLDTNVALTGLTMQANNAPAGVTPTVWTLGVSQQGIFNFTQVPLGGGKP